MKRIVLLLLAVCSLFTVGCAGTLSPGFGNEAQYEKGDWYGVGNLDEVARIKQDKLALKKLEAGQIKTATVGDATMGYEGVVMNTSEETYNFVLAGPEEKSYLLGPGERARDYLIPGSYTCTVYHAGKQIGKPWPFKVKVQKHIVSGEAYHWYVYM